VIPLWRLVLPHGQWIDAPAAWLPFPELHLERLEQRYRREDAHRVHYQAPGPGYDDTLVVDEHGFVTLYPVLFESVAFAGGD
jgi:uncharacterized protein